MLIELKNLKHSIIKTKDLVILDQIKSTQH